MPGTRSMGMDHVIRSHQNVPSMQFNSSQMVYCKARYGAARSGPTRRCEWRAPGRMASSERLLVSLWFSPPHCL